MPFPNSAAEAATFDAAASGARALVTVESASAGPVHQPADSAGGDDHGTDFSGSPQQILNVHSPSCGGTAILCGFNTAPGGSNYAQLFGGTLTYSFATPVDAFGALPTGVNLTGETVRSNDGSSETLTIPNSGGRVLWLHRHRPADQQHHSQRQCGIVRRHHWNGRCAFLRRRSRGSGTDEPRLARHGSGRLRLAAAALWCKSER
jgi:hypothetical protein